MQGPSHLAQTWGGLRVCKIVPCGVFSVRLRGECCHFLQLGEPPQWQGSEPGVNPVLLREGRVSLEPASMRGNRGAAASSPPPNRWLSGSHGSALAEYTSDVQFPDFIRGADCDFGALVSLSPLKAVLAAAQAAGCTSPVSDQHVLRRWLLDYFLLAGQWSGMPGAPVFCPGPRRERNATTACAHEAVCADRLCALSPQYERCLGLRRHFRLYGHEHRRALHGLRRGVGPYRALRGHLCVLVEPQGMGPRVARAPPGTLLPSASPGGRLAGDPPGALRCPAWLPLPQSPQQSPQGSRPCRESAGIP